MAVRESPEIAAVVQRIGEAWAARDFETYANQVSQSPHFRGIGTDADEFWDSADAFLRIRRVQTEELTAQGWGRSTATIERIDAFEDGPVGWASILLAIKTPAGTVNLRATSVLSLEAGAWRVIQWHTSVPAPNIETFGVELTTTLEQLLDAVAEDEAAMRELESSQGMKALVFTDIVDSTTLTERMGDRDWVDLWTSHSADIRDITNQHDGTVIKMLGDGSMLAFDSTRAAVEAALAIQASTGDAFAVRIGIHAGEVVPAEGDLFGVAVNKAARVASIAGGGEVLVSSVVADLIGTDHGWVFGSPRSVSLKGLGGSHQVVTVEAGPT